MMRLSDMAQVLGGNLHGDDAEFTGVTQDTRTLAVGHLYVALHGDRFDGHDFVRRAASLGAAGALVQRRVDCPLPQVQVPDSLAGLQRLAAHWRRACGVPVVAVTGSNGKTTVKQMLAAVFGQAGSVLATQGNLNNHIGVPLTLLRLRAGHRMAVIEMGANHVGEIAALCKIAHPDIGIVTQASGAHLDGFGSLDGIVRGKGELFQGLDSNGIAIINADDPAADRWLEMAGDRRVMRFGLECRGADVCARTLDVHFSHAEVGAQTPIGDIDFTLPMPGRHNVCNALATTAAAIAAGLDADTIAAGLEAVKPPAGRLSFRTAPSGLRLIDDTYNANPTSLRAAVEVLAQQPGRRWLVLGDMLELGADERQAHADAGAMIRDAGIDRLFTVGELAAHAGRAFGGPKDCHDNQDSLMGALRAALRQVDVTDVVVAFKGSRGARMERCVEALMRDGDTNGPGEASAA